MTEVPAQYQVCYYADLSAVEPTAENIASLVKQFGDKRLLPTTYQEIGAKGLRMRLRFQAVETGWVVDLDSQRIDVQKKATSATGENLGSLDEFFRDAQDILTAVLTVRAVRGRRLSLVTTAWLRNLNEEALQQAYLCLFRPLPYYREFPPVAWSSQTVTRVPVVLGEREETMNVIFMTDRAERRFLFDPSQPPFESIQVTADINTHQTNTETRFSVDSMPEFLARAVELRTQVLQQLRERLHD